MSPEFSESKHVIHRVRKPDNEPKQIPKSEPPFRFLDREVFDAFDNQYLSAHKAITSLKTQKELQQAVADLERLIADYKGDHGDIISDTADTMETEHRGVPTKAVSEKLLELQSGERYLIKGVGNLKQLLIYAKGELEDLKLNEILTKKPPKK